MRGLACVSLTWCFVFGKKRKTPLECGGKGGVGRVERAISKRKAHGMVKIHLEYNSPCWDCGFGQKRHDEWSKKRCTGHLQN
jgi:hypothetical protein